MARCRQDVRANVYFTYGKRNQKTGELSGLAIRTVRSHKFIINAALNEAVEEEVLARNPALNIKVSNAKKKSLAKKIVFFSLEESREFLKFVYDEEDVLADMIYATLQYGLRRFSKEFFSRRKKINFSTAIRI